MAFLLYRHRNAIRSEDILILSPNRVFADYTRSTPADRRTRRLDRV